MQILYELNGCTCWCNEGEMPTGAKQVWPEVGAKAVEPKNKKAKAANKSRKVATK